MVAIATMATMAEPLTAHFGAEVPRWLARTIVAAGQPLDAERFVADALDGFEPLPLMQRGTHLARVLRAHLPDDYPRAVDLLLAAARGEPPPSRAGDHGMSVFAYLPHTAFVAGYGLAHFEESMRALHELTQRFTGEFAIRPFLERHRDATLARLRDWAIDPSPQVRRLVSEGTRPRLPWAPRLRAFQADPSPVLALLELLKDDPELNVRRSVANNLNDIGKDHPDRVVATLARWREGAGAQRLWIVRHALRSAVKRGEPGALDLLGYGGRARVTLAATRIAPRRAEIGGSITLEFELTNPTACPQRALVDCRVHFVKAGGRIGPRVFKLRTVEIAPGASVVLAKRVSLAELTTRSHYPGRHRVEVLLNGAAVAAGEFEVVAARAPRARQAGAAAPRAANTSRAQRKASMPAGTPQ